MITLWCRWPDQWVTISLGRRTSAAEPRTKCDARPLARRASRSHRSIAVGYVRMRTGAAQRQARRGSAAAREGHGGSRAAGRLGGAAAGPPDRRETRLRRGSRGARGVKSGRAVGWSGRGTPRQERDAAPPRLARGTGGRERPGGWVERPRDPPTGERRGSAAAREGHGGSRAAGRLGGAAAGPPDRRETRLRRDSPGGTGGQERPGGWVERPRDSPTGERRGSAAARRGARGVKSGRAVGWSGRGPPDRIVVRRRRRPYRRRNAVSVTTVTPSAASAARNPSRSCGFTNIRPSPSIMTPSSAADANTEVAMLSSTHEPTR